MEKRLFGGEIVVQKYHMLPTPRPGERIQWIYSAWQKIVSPFDDHRAHTITTVDGVWFGKIGSDPEPEKYDHLPVGPERFAAVRDAYRYRALIAEQYIHDAFPETRGHYAEEFGEIEITKEA